MLKVLRHISNLLLWPTIPTMWVLAFILFATTFIISIQSGKITGMFYAASGAVVLSVSLYIPYLAFMLRIFYMVLSDTWDEQSARGWILRLAPIVLIHTLICVVVLFGQWRRITILGLGCLMVIPDMITIVAARSSHAVV